ncbi:hypothetical protein C8T65DRAFT_703797 [Cerioporus squamosus]|nr:hypothetical protein C8T65DRAFT_703797 [Cerioporus squamosus]
MVFLTVTWPPLLVVLLNVASSPVVAHRRSSRLYPVLLDDNDDHLPPGFAWGYSPGQIGRRHSRRPSPQDSRFDFAMGSSLPDYEDDDSSTLRSDDGGENEIEGSQNGVPASPRLDDHPQHDPSVQDEQEQQLEQDDEEQQQEQAEHDSSAASAVVLPAGMRHQELGFPEDLTFRAPVVDRNVISQLEQSGVVIDRQQHVLLPVGLKAQVYGGLSVVQPTLADVRCVKCGTCISLDVDCEQTNGTSWKCKGCLPDCSTSPPLLDHQSIHASALPAVPKAYKWTVARLDVGKLALPLPPTVLAVVPVMALPLADPRQPAQPPSAHARDEGNQDQASPPPTLWGGPRLTAFGEDLGRVAAAEERQADAREREARAREQQAASQLRSEALLREQRTMLRALCSFLQVDGYEDADADSARQGSDRDNAEVSDDEHQSDREEDSGGAGGSAVEVAIEYVRTVMIKLGLIDIRTYANSDWTKCAEHRGFALHHSSIFPFHHHLTIMSMTAPTHTGDSSTAPEEYPLVKYAHVDLVQYAMTDDLRPEAGFKRGGVMIAELVPGEFAIIVTGGMYTVTVDTCIVVASMEIIPDIPRREIRWSLFNAAGPKRWTYLRFGSRSHLATFAKELFIAHENVTVRQSLMDARLYDIAYDIPSNFTRYCRRYLGEDYFDKLPESDSEDNSSELMARYITTLHGVQGCNCLVCADSSPRLLTARSTASRLGVPGGQAYCSHAHGLGRGHVKQQPTPPLPGPVAHLNDDLLRPGRRHAKHGLGGSFEEVLRPTATKFC